VKNPVLSGDAHVSRAAPEQKGGEDQQQELPEPCQEEPEVGREHDRADQGGAILGRVAASYM
jgi:hypothetical protein